MGAPKQKWTPEEEQALRAGIAKHGAGKWRTIQKDPEFSQYLATRSNIDLKDKWRNLSVSASGQGSREKSKTPKAQAVAPAAVSGSESPATPAPVSAPVKQENLSTNPSTNVDTAKLSAKYNSMIFEAISALNESNGSEVVSIFNYIEQKHEVPPNFRKLLSSKLRRLLAQGKIERVQKGYKMKDSSFATKTPSLKQKEPVNRPKPVQQPDQSTTSELTLEAFEAAAYKVAEAEAKAFLASEAVKEAERVSRMTEEAEMMYLLAKEIHEQCCGGEVLMLMA